MKCGINPEDTQTPHVIQGVMQTWLCRKWNLSKLSELIGNEMVKFRIGPRLSTDGTDSANVGLMYCYLQYINASTSTSTLLGEA